MPGVLLHVGAAVQCPHQAPAQTPPNQVRVLVSGQPVVTSANQYMVTGCPFTLPGPKPSPCLTIRWTMPAARVLASGQPVLLGPAPGPGAGLCLSPEQTTQGPPLIGTVQTRVFGS